MKKMHVGTFAMIACVFGSLFADGYGRTDKGLIAGKGEFPGPGSEGEGVLPEADTTDDSTNPMKAPSQNSKGQAEKGYTPEVQSNQPGGSKDVFPETKAPTQQPSS
jgi:hypothetical protein